MKMETKTSVLLYPCAKIYKTFKNKREIKEGRHFVQAYLKNYLDHDIFVKIHRSVPRGELVHPQCQELILCIVITKRSH